MGAVACCSSLGQADARSFCEAQLTVAPNVCFDSATKLAETGSAMLVYTNIRTCLLKAAQPLPGTLRFTGLPVLRCTGASTKCSRDASPPETLRRVLGTVPL